MQPTVGERPATSRRVAHAAYGRRMGLRRGLPMSPKRVRGYFAGRYLEMVDPALKGSPHERLASLIRDDEAKVLEVCSATGYLSRIVATRFPGARVWALDLSPELIAQGRRRARDLHNLEFVRADATAMPFPDGIFNVVLAAFGLSELPSVARSECIREIDRVLTARGRLLVVDIDEPSRHAGLFHAYRYLARRRRTGEVLGNGLSRQIGTRGFTVVSHVNGEGRLLPFQVIVADHAPTDART